jgi:hypothetical protein
MVRNFLTSLGVECITHTPGRPWAKGSVEKGHDVWEKYFESRLVNAPARVLDDLAQRAAHHVRLLNEQEKHRRHGMTRQYAWETLAVEQRRPAPTLDVCWDLFAPRSDSRIVGEDLSVQYRGKLWRTGATELRGRKVMVRPSPASAEEIYLTEEGKAQIIHVAKYVGKDFYGFADDAKSMEHPHTPFTDALLKEVEALKRANAAAAVAACAGPAAMTGAPAEKVLRGEFSQEKNEAEAKPTARKTTGGDAPLMFSPAVLMPATKLISAMDARSKVLDELAPLSAEEKFSLDALLANGGETAESKVLEWIAGVNAARAAAFAAGERKQA